MKYFIFWIVIIFMLIYLSGCSGLNEGAIDYRYIQYLKKDANASEKFTTRYFSVTDYSGPRK